MLVLVRDTRPPTETMKHKAGHKERRNVKTRPRRKWNQNTTKEDKDYDDDEQDKTGGGKDQFETNVIATATSPVGRDCALRYSPSRHW